MISVKSGDLIDCLFAIAALYGGWAVTELGWKVFESGNGA